MKLILNQIKKSFILERLPHRPIMDQQYPSNQTVYLGDTVVFECRFVSDLHPSMQWLKFYEVNGSWFDENDEPYAKQVRVNLHSNS